MTPAPPTPGTVYCGDALGVLRGWPSNCVDCVVTSPPYFGLRDYGVAGQIGLEPTLGEYLAKLAAVFDEVRRVLKPRGTLWLNIGDSYASGGRGGNSTRASSTLEGSTDSQEASIVRRARQTPGFRSKNKMLIPERLAIALQDAGWFVRDQVCWVKGREYSADDIGLNPMPGSQRDRCTSAWEPLFQFTKAAKYYFDWRAIAEPLRESSVARLAQNVEAQLGSERVVGKTNGNMKAVGGARATAGYHAEAGAGVLNPHQQRAARQFPNQGELVMPRNVWPIPARGFKGDHYATFPEELARRCILASCPEGGLVLDPFLGSGTVGLVATQLGRRWIGIELNPKTVRLAQRRTGQRGLFVPEGQGKRLRAKGPRAEGKAEEVTN